MLSSDLDGINLLIANQAQRMNSCFHFTVIYLFFFLKADYFL